MSSPRFPEPPSAVAATPFDVLDAAVERVAAHKDEWTKLGIPERIRLLERCIDGLVAVADAWVADACRAKGISPDDPLAGEEWIAGPSSTIRNARLLIRSLEALGQRPPPKVSAREDGQLVARVFPADGYDKAMFAGISCEVWIEPGRPASQGRIYREPSAGGRVSLVLGAGNVSSIAPMDVFYKLLVENEVVVLKTNPVNAYLGVHWERALAPFIEAGYLAIVHGGGKEGAYLAEHPQIDTLHVTGSDKTYDAIVWGSSSEEQAKRKAAHDPKNKRPFTAELGCVTPVLVVPGPWSAADMDYQARQVAAMVANNASFNCTAAKVLVVAKGWLQRETFLRKVEAALAATPPRKAYYPGATDRWRAFLDRYPKARVLAAEADRVVPWTLIPDVAPEGGEYALSNEAFCGVLATVTLDASGPVDFLAKAVDFANDRCWGTLSCVMLVHPSTREEHPREVDRAIAALRYGAIGVNAWSSLAYALVSPTWGAFPGHTPEDIQSGTGVVHNSFLLDHPQKSVVFAPFRIRPTPAWFADHRNLLRVGKKLTEMEARPSFAEASPASRSRAEGVIVSRARGATLDTMEARRSSREGEVLASKYRLDALLGAGGMGEVYRAENLALGRPVAIKVLREEHGESAEVVMRFLREARATNIVRHPNVVDVLDVGQAEDGSPFIVQELLEGEDLAAYAHSARRPAGDPGGDRAPHPRGRRRRVRARPRRHPPRPQAREHLPRARSHGRGRPQAARLRHLAHRHGRGAADDGHRHVDRDAGVHVPRADPRRGGGRAHGHLVDRRHPVRDPRRRSPVPVVAAERPLREDRDRAAGAARPRRSRGRPATLAAVVDKCRRRARSMVAMRARPISRATSARSSGCAAPEGSRGGGAQAPLERPRPRSATPRPARRSGPVARPAPLVRRPRASPCARAELAEPASPRAARPAPLRAPAPRPARHRHRDIERRAHPDERCRQIEPRGAILRP